jgi:hypothetical protein
VTNSHPYLGRCKQQGCTYALFATPEQVRNANDASDIKAGTGPWRINPYGVMARCPSSHKMFPLRQIKGTYSEAHKCDARCLNAKGHDCTCSCGGANHGRGYAVEIQTVSASPESDRPTFVKRDRVLVAMISERQISFVRTLLSEREIPDNGGRTGAQRRERAETIVETMTQSQARNTIDWLKTLPYRSA